jgi:hypothetical protein
LWFFYYYYFILFFEISNCLVVCFYDSNNHDLVPHQIVLSNPKQPGVLSSPHQRHTMPETFGGQPTHNAGPIMKQPNPNPNPNQQQFPGTMSNPRLMNQPGMLAERRRCNSV